MGDDQDAAAAGKKVRMARIGSKCSCENFSPDYFCNAKKCRNHCRPRVPATAEPESDDVEVDLNMMFPPNLVDESDDEFAAADPKP